MPVRRTADDEVAQQYAAHRLELVRLAALLLGDASVGEVSVAEDLVHRAFLRYLRGGGARRDPGSGLAALRTLVVRECRTTSRRRHAVQPPVTVGAGQPAGPSAAATDRLNPGDRLSVPQREVVALIAWAGLSARQAALVLGTSERAVLTTAGRARDISGETDADLGEIMHRRADAVHASDLRGSWGDVLAEDARLSARTRHGWRAVVGVVAATAAVVAAATLIGTRPASETPAPLPTPSVAATETLSSPALAPGEQPRSAIPWNDVHPGWVVVAASAPPTAVTTTVLLVSPGGMRYALGTAPDSIVVQDVSPDGRRLLLAVGSQASEWDLVAGTSRSLGVSYGWKTMRYAGGPDRGYLVLWTDSNSAVQVDHWNPDGRLVAAYPLTLPPTAGSPGTPGVVVDRTGRQAVVATRDGTIASIDLGVDAVGTLPLPDGVSGCALRSTWSATEVLAACSSGGGRLFLVPLDGSAPRPLGGSGLVGAWATARTTVVQRDDPCSTSVGALGADGAVTALAPAWPASLLVPNTVVDGVLYLGGTRCPADGSRLVAYDVASGRTTVLAGEDAGGRTVRQAVVLQPRD